MSDSLRDRIAAVLREHVEDQLTNYDAERNECGCGNQGLSGYKDHVADAVIEELSLKPQSEVYKYGPIMPDGFQQALLRHRYVTEWRNDE